MWPFLAKFWLSWGSNGDISWLFLTYFGHALLIPILEHFGAIFDFLAIFNISWLFLEKIVHLVTLLSTQQRRDPLM